MKTSSIILGALLAAGCTEQLETPNGPTSIRVELVSPVDRGSIDDADRLDDADRTIAVNLTVLDAFGQPDTSFNGDVQAYVQYLGTLTPYLTGVPIATVTLVNGKTPAPKMIMLPVTAFGPTTVWFDDNKNAEPTHVTGVSEPLWFRDPYIRDIQTPRDEMALDALSSSPLEAKQISVRKSRHGAVGRLVVTSVFAQGYTVSDVKCADADGRPPCTSEAYDHIMIFSFSAPRFDEESTGMTAILQQGQVINGFNGGISEFNGLTEIGFPRTFVKGEVQIDEARIPPPKTLEAGRPGETNDWFGPLSDPQGVINFERNEAAPIEILNGVVCKLDDDYTTYKQWKIDPKGMPTPGGAVCPRAAINVISSGLTDLDPTLLVGKTLPRLVGVVRPVSIGSFNVWIVFPRTDADVTQ